MRERERGKTFGRLEMEGGVAASFQGLPNECFQVPASQLEREREEPEIAKFETQKVKRFHSHLYYFFSRFFFDSFSSAHTQEGKGNTLFETHT